MSNLSRRFFMKSMLLGATAAVPGVSLLAQDVPAPAPRESLLCPILMYHYISEPPPNADRFLRDLAVPPAIFAQHLDFLQADGFTTITMAQLWRIMLNLEPSPPKPVVLTFDDGYWDAYAHAALLLLERGMTGVFYVVADFIDQPGFLTAPQVGELHNLGFEIGNHSKTHNDMSRMESETQRFEIDYTTQVLSNITGIAPTTFCYPLGRYNRLSGRVLAQSGYTTAVTTSDATLHAYNNPYYMGRVRVRSTTTTSALNWLVNRVA